MDLKESIEKYKQFKVPSLSVICEKASQYSKTCLLFIVLFILFLVLALQCVPQWQVAHFGITKPKDLADAENSYRATLAQILGGVAIGIGLYYTWRRTNIAEDNLRVTQEGQITERFTRAVDQLGANDQFGNPAIEIRLGGIYALERIANEYDKDYWPIVEILTAYVRKNSSSEIIVNKKLANLTVDIQAKESTTIEVPVVRKISLDIQAVLTVLGRRKNSFHNGETHRLNLQGTYLQNADLMGAHLESANLMGAHLEGANFMGAHLESANFMKAHLEGANFIGAHLESANFMEAHLEGARLWIANLKGANLIVANLKEANFLKANLEGAKFLLTNLEGANFRETNLEGTNLPEAHLEGDSLSLNQLSKIKTLYNAKLDKELLISLKEKYPALFEEPNE